MAIFIIHNNFEHIFVYRNTDYHMENVSSIIFKDYNKESKSAVVTRQFNSLGLYPELVFCLLWDCFSIMYWTYWWWNLKGIFFLVIKNKSSERQSLSVSLWKWSFPVFLRDCNFQPNNLQLVSISFRFQKRWPSSLILVAMPINQEGVEVVKW